MRVFHCKSHVTPLILELDSLFLVDYSNTEMYQIMTTSKVKVSFYQMMTTTGKVEVGAGA